MSVGLTIVKFPNWSPTPRVAFVRTAGQLLSPDEHRNDYDTELVIVNVTQEDEGEYICRGFNTAGMSETVTIVLDVQGKLVFIRMLQKCTPARKRWSYTALRIFGTPHAPPPPPPPKKKKKKKLPYHNDMNIQSWVFHFILILHLPSKSISMAGTRLK